MKSIFSIFGRVLALVLFSIGLLRPDVAIGSQLTQSHGTLAAQLGWASPPPLTTGWLAIPAPPGLAVGVNIGATLGLTFASVSMDGSGSLNYSQYPGNGTLSFANTSGTASMNIGFQTWAQYQFTYQGNTTTGDLPILPNVDFLFADQKSFDSYLLGQTITLSDTIDDIQIVSVGSADLNLPNDVVDMNVGISITPALQCGLSGVSLQTSAGNFYSAADLQNVNLNSPSLTVSGISQKTHCDFTAEITPNITIEATVLGFQVFDGTYPVSSPFTIPLTSTDISTTPSQSITFNLSSSTTAPVITSVSPATLTTSSSQQPIKIYGTGFTSSSTLLFNGSIASDPARLAFVSANEIDYNIIVLSAGSWSVQVVNGSQTSNTNYFTVNTPSADTGSLVVNLSPSGANSAGAQWQVDATGFNNSGQWVGYITPGLHTISFKSISGYTAPASFNVNIVANQQTTTNATYTAVAATTYTLTLNQGGSMGSITPSPSGTWNGSAYVYTAGSQVQLTANANPGYHFVSWSGDASGIGNAATITMNGNRTVSANFASGDPNMGAISVTIQPPAAAAAGVTWGFNANDYRASGSSYTTWPATYLLNLHPVDGWLGPFNLVGTIIAGQTTNYTVTFTADTTPGLLTVTLSPPNAVAAGAKWRVNGGAAQGSGASLSLPPGSGYVITFDAAAGWAAPSAQTVTVSRAQTSVATGNYTPPVGQPSVTSVQPSVGALAGGTLLTIQGFNFTAPLSVTVGGQTASNVTLSGTSQITCQTPASSVYGTAAIVVQTQEGSSTNANGFAYGFPRGNGIQLAGSIGGYLDAMAVQGSYGYSVEGSTFIVFDFSNPSSPTPVARLAMPGIGFDVALFSVSGRQYAAVANYDSGLQIVDITTPTAPVLRGYYNTGDYAFGVAVLGSTAYVANGNSGLMVCDVSNPSRPQRISSLSIGSGNSDRLIIQPSGTNLFAYVSTGGALAVVDVSNATAPVLRGTTAAITQSWALHSLAFLNNRVYLADGFREAQVVDVSNPNAPVALGIAFNGMKAAVASANGYIYAWNGGLEIYNFPGGIANRVGVCDASGAVLSQGDTLAIFGGIAVGTGGDHGLYTIDVSNPSSPVSRGAYTATAGYYNATAIKGNVAFSVTQNSGLKIFDVSNPAAPSLLSLYATAGGERVSVATNRLYTLSKILDVTNPSSPQLLGTISQSPIFVQDFYLIGNRMMVCGVDTNYVPLAAILNTSNPSAISVEGTYRYSTNNYCCARWITGNNSVACVAIADKTGTAFSLSVVNASNFSSPQQVGLLPGIGNVKVMRLAPDNRYLYVGCWSTDLSWKIIDLVNSNAPVMVSSNYVGVGVYGFDFADTTAYVATQNGVLVYDVSNPSQPQLLRSYSTPAVSVDVRVSGNNLYVADANGGLTILSLTDVNAPQVLITAPTSSAVYTNATGTIDLGGSANDNLGLVHGSISVVTWANDRGGGGNTVGTTNWSVSGITLLPGTNILSLTATDTSGNSSNDTLTVIYQTTNQNQTITFLSITNHTFGDAPIPLVAAASSGLPVTFRVVSGSASISNNVLTLTGAGAVTVEANQPGNSSFNPATPVDVSFNVARANQSIAFAPIPSHSAGDAPFALTATTSSGLPVNFDVISGPATTSSNLVTLLGGGSATVIAWQPGNSNYNAAATVQQSFTISKIPQTITFGALAQQKAGDAPFPLTASTDSGLPVSFSASGPATLSGNIVTLTGWGTVTVTASQPGNNTYAAAANVVQSLVVLPPNNTLVGVGFQTNGGFQLAFYGMVGSNYTLQVSTNLHSWLPVTNFNYTNSPFSLWDTSATNHNRRFYRAVMP